MKIHELDKTAFEKAYSDFINEMIAENRQYGDCKTDYTKEEFIELSNSVDWTYGLNGQFIE